MGPQAIREQAFEDYDSVEQAREHCDRAGGGDADDLALAESEVLLLDAAPQCDLERLGLTDEDEVGARRVIDASAVAGEPAYAMCSCTELEASNRIMAPGESDIVGDLGANQRIFGSAPIRVDGMVVSGETARFDNVFEAQELRVDDVLTAANETTIGGDAVLGGLDVPGERVSVGGTLTVPEGTDLSSVEASGEVVFEDVNVPGPCECSADIDYVALRAEFRDQDGDNVDDYEEYQEYAEDFDGPYLYPAPPYLLSELDAGRTLYLGCGRYYFDAIESAAALTLAAVGDVEVFVDGDVNVAGPLEIRVDEDASLDLFVAGTFNPTNTVDLGNPGEPDALRLYVRDELRFAGPVVLSGAVFAPNAPFIANNTLENQGAVFTQQLDFAGPIQVTDGPRFTGDGCLLWDEADANLE